LTEYESGGPNPKPGARFGPYCVTCDELMLWFSVPYQKDLDKAAEWVKENRPDLLVHSLRNCIDPSCEKRHVEEVDHPPSTTRAS